MNELRLAWEPRNSTPLPEIENFLSHFLVNNKGGVTILSNGTLLFTPSGRNDLEDAKNALEEAKYLIDFNITPIRNEAYFVDFHPALSVFVGIKEFQNLKSEIRRRIEELKFPEEVFFQGEQQPNDNLLIGLYARGKLQYDAYHFSFYKRVNG